MNKQLAEAEADRLLFAMKPQEIVVHYLLTVNHLLLIQAMGAESNPHDLRAANQALANFERRLQRLGMARPGKARAVLDLLAAVCTDTMLVTEALRSEIDPKQA